MNIFLVCALTVLIETPFLALFGYRARDELTVIVCANVLTNLLVNLSLALFLPANAMSIFILESAAVLICSQRLFLLTLAANCLSFGLGLLLL